MKKIVFFIFIFSLCFFKADSASAYDQNKNSSDQNRNVGLYKEKVQKNIITITPSATRTPLFVTKTPIRLGRPSATPSANQVENLKQRANKEIERRITNLNRLVEKLRSMKKINSNQKDQFINQIQEEIKKLTALRGKINSDSDLVTLKTDTKSITESYRIYLLFIPKINVLVAADSLDEAADKLSSLSGKLETRVNTANDANSTEQKTRLATMRAKIADMRIQAENARNSVLALTVEGYPSNKNLLLQGRQYVQTGKKDLQTARRDAELIIKSLKGRSFTKESTSSVTKAKK